MIVFLEAQGTNAYNRYAMCPAGLIAFHIATNTLGKGMNPIILPPAMGKIVGQTKFFSLGEATSLGEGKL